MRSSLTWVAIAIFLAPGAQAHPPTSVVADSQGRIFFSDLENVWMVGTDGTVRVAVAGVHTHELFLDDLDQLFGEDVTNIGDSFRHMIWVREPDGMVRDVLAWRSGHPVDYSDYSFVRDGAGQSYVLNRGDRTLAIRDSARVVRTVPLPGEGHVHWSTVSSSGHFHVAVGDALFGLPPGGETFVGTADDVGGRSVLFSFVGDRHSLMGMWLDGVGSVFVADFRGRRVKRVGLGGLVATVYESGGVWSPVGGSFHGDDMLILEASPTNQVRVVRIRQDGSRTVYRTS